MLAALQYSPRLTAFLRAHGDSVDNVALSRDGKMLASVDSDGTVILWDTQSRLGEPLRGHEFGVHSVAFSPDGRILASGSSDARAGTVILWDVDIESWKERACQTANRNLTRSEWAQYLKKDPF